MLNNIELENGRGWKHAQDINMETVFGGGNYDLLVETLPWMYRIYHTPHFSYDYFLLYLKTYMLDLDKYLDSSCSSEIKSIYHWMIRIHSKIVALSK